MDFALNDEQKLIVETVRRFLQRASTAPRWAGLAFSRDGRWLADLVPLGGLGHRGSICLTQDRDHLLLGESTPSHALLAGREPFF